MPEYACAVAVESAIIAVWKISKRHKVSVTWKLMCQYICNYSSYKGVTWGEHGDAD